eukprot:scaffold12.g8094.t1
MPRAVLLVLSICACACAAAASDYLVGVGKADITGPAADVNMMGYANPDMFARGIHLRLYARALIVADPAANATRFAFVNLDACMASQAVTFTVIAKLRERYGGLYTEQNVALSGTHTHSGPAGYLQYLVYDITTLGFYPQTFNALVDGILLAIQRAHDALQPGSLAVSEAELLEANINRRHERAPLPTAYVENPEEEKARYKHNIDKNMMLLRVHDAAGRGIGAFSWFPVHGTSMNETNSLISGDNKGAAAQFMEHWAAAQPAEVAAPGFVAAFCQANVGDTSPNTLGPACMDTGLPCDAVHSTCGGRVQQCVGRGPGWPDHFESTRIIGQKQARENGGAVPARRLARRACGRPCALRPATTAPPSPGARLARAQADAAQALFGADGAAVRGPIEYRHAFLDMRGLEVAASAFTRAGATCKPAMGFAFAAGTTDGPGAFDFKQSDTNGTAFWRLVRNFITKPTAEQEACHEPKPILLDVGEMHFPYEWVPYIVEIQILRVGQLVILAVPGEFTTMAGRRLRRAVAATVREAWGDVRVVIAGLTNTYSSYVTTWEEYQVQRYEGGFTLYGPHTLDAYIQEFTRLAAAMAAHAPTDPGPPPPNELPKQWSLVPPVVADGTPWGKSFGDVAREPARDAYAPGETVEVVFHSACPRNNIRAEGTFLTVDRQTAGGDWAPAATDADWATKFAWARPSPLSTESYATISWAIPQGTPPGTYRITHSGDYKHFLGSVHPFSGSSRPFQVVAPGGPAGARRGGWLARLADGLSALGRRAAAGGSWVMRSLEERS